MREQSWFVHALCCGLLHAVPPCHVSNQAYADVLLFTCTVAPAGGGLVFWHPAGALVRHEVESFWKQLHLQRGYQLVYSPHVAKSDLWVTSGHMEFYRESMFDQMQVHGHLGRRQIG
jgi:threonyl-tRNA synthetase